MSVNLPGNTGTHNCCRLWTPWKVFTSIEVMPWFERLSKGKQTTLTSCQQYSLNLRKGNTDALKWHQKSAISEVKRLEMHHFQHIKKEAWQKRNEKHTHRSEPDGTEHSTGQLVLLRIPATTPNVHSTCQWHIYIYCADTRVISLPYRSRPSIHCNLQPLYQQRICSFDQAKMLRNSWLTDVTQVLLLNEQTSPVEQSESWVHCLAIYTRAYKVSLCLRCFSQNTDWHTIKQIAPYSVQE